MKSQYLLKIIFISLLISCSNTESSEDSCIDSVLESQGMEPYRNQEIQCEFYLVSYEFQNAQYFTLNSHCADLGRHIVLDCEGKELCETDSEWCDNFFAGAMEIEIVGIEV